MCTRSLSLALDESMNQPVGHGFVAELLDQLAKAIPAMRTLHSVGIVWDTYTFTELVPFQTAAPEVTITSELSSLTSIVLFGVGVDIIIGVLSLSYIFQRLQELSLVHLKSRGKLGDQKVDRVKYCFLNLQSLTLHETQEDGIVNYLIAWFCQTRIPRIQSFFVTVENISCDKGTPFTKFLRVHGEHMRTIILDMKHPILSPNTIISYCPYLRSISLPVQKFTSFRDEWGHMNLESIALIGWMDYTQRPDEQTLLLIGRLSRQSYPKWLTTTLEIRSRSTWPITPANLEWSAHYSATSGLIEVDDRKQSTKTSYYMAHHTYRRLLHRLEGIDSLNDY